ncbi:uncharacterized protein LOC121390469 [Gigantopelta aegis]|uniref:uncharacterized protein LOC121390469 n=1 Tax=Gigantopelta aegis TaxID=1735272 RepID=UPI001B887B72|nr:uncharacterized protein LOC121390469 [Gigantopelta aegis]XP_041378227.1 uncharacterized protein LOC121390469 [Gigantopelta aegis]
MSMTRRRWTEEEILLAMKVNALILGQGRQLGIRNLKKELKRNYRITVRSKELLHLLEEFHNNFGIKRGVNQLVNVLVISKTDVSRIKICTEFAKKGGSCRSDMGECGGLHICKFFLLSDCCNFGPNCCFGHDFGTVHNHSVLKSHFINSSDISIDKLRDLFRRIENRNFSTMPDTCKFYNTSKTCKNENCKSLHLCRHFLEGCCKFGNSCMRNHEIRDATVLEILDHYGFDVCQQKDQILKDLKSFYIKRVSDVSPSDGFGSASSVCNSDPDRLYCGGIDLTSGEEFEFGSMGHDPDEGRWNCTRTEMFFDDSDVTVGRRKSERTDMNFDEPYTRKLNFGITDMTFDDPDVGKRIFGITDMTFDDPDAGRHNYGITNMTFDDPDASRRNFGITDMTFDDLDADRHNFGITDMTFDDPDASRRNCRIADMTFDDPDASRRPRRKTDVSSVNKRRSRTFGYDPDWSRRDRRLNEISQRRQGTPYDSSCSRDRSRNRSTERSRGQYSLPYDRGLYSRDRSRSRSTERYGGRLGTPYDGGSYSRDQSRSSRCTERGQARRISRDGRYQMPATQQNSSNTPPASQTNSSSTSVAKQLNSSRTPLAKGQTNSSIISAKGQNSLNSSPAKGQTSSSPSPAKGQTSSSPSPAKGKTSSNISALKGLNSSRPSLAKGQNSLNSSLAKDQNSSNTSLVTGITSSNVPSTTWQNSKTSLVNRQNSSTWPPTAMSTSISNAAKEPSLTICIHELRGKCLFGSVCKNQHKPMIYQWQWKSHGDASWMDFNKEENLQLEKAFCQVDNMECYLDMSGDVVKIDFISMRASGDYFGGAVHRLSTISSKNAHTGIYKWTTVWHWYWQDDDKKWKEYGKADKNGQKSEARSDAIEEKYLENPNGSFKFRSGEIDYLLLFSKMQQINIKTMTSRDVQRRPTFFTRSDIEKRTLIVSPDTSMSVNVPKEWTVSGQDLFKHYQELEVSKAAQEFQEMNKLFRKTLPHKTITSLKRIENGELWNSFCQKREQMKRRLGKEVDERPLFHGTHSDNIKAICRQGFDFRFCGKAVGTLYGKGSYFATESSYSDGYTGGSNMMFVALTLVGDFARGNPSYWRCCEDRLYIYESKWRLLWRGCSPVKHNLIKERSHWHLQMDDNLALVLAGW